MGSIPHLAVVDVKQQDGTWSNWAIEAGSRTSLFRRGFTRDFAAARMDIVIDGYQSKDGSHRANGPPI